MVYLIDDELASIKWFSTGLSTWKIKESLNFLDTQIMNMFLTPKLFLYLHPLTELLSSNPAKYWI